MTRKIKDGNLLLMLTERTWGYVCGPRDLFNEQRIEITLSSNDAVNLSILGRP